MSRESLFSKRVSRLNIPPQIGNTDGEICNLVDGGNFLLGGSVLGRQDYIDFGLALVNGCHDLYNSTLTGIGPESFSWNTTGVDSTNEAFYNANGFYITDQLYDLRPEVIESFYYAYRITGKASIAIVGVRAAG